MISDFQFISPGVTDASRDLMNENALLQKPLAMM